MKNLCTWKLIKLTFLCDQIQLWYPKNSLFSNFCNNFKVKYIKECIILLYETTMIEYLIIYPFLENGPFGGLYMYVSNEVNGQNWKLYIDW